MSSTDLIFCTTVTAADVDKASWTISVVPDTIENRWMLQAVRCRSDPERVVAAALERSGLGGEIAGFCFAENGHDPDGQKMADDVVGVYCSAEDEGELLVEDRVFFDFLAHYLVFVRRPDLASRAAAERDRLAANR